MKLKELADRLKLELRGDGAIEISMPAPIEAGLPGTIIFVAGPRYAAALRATNASCAIVPAELAGDAPCATLISGNPYADFSRVLDIFFPSYRPPAGIDASARIAPDAKLGAGASVGAGAVIGAGTTIGRNAVMHPNVTIYPNVRVGDDFVCHSGASIREGVVIGNRVTICNGALLAGYVSVGDGAFVSGHATVHQFTRIGRLAMIGGLARVNRDVPPFMLVKGDSLVWSLNAVGLRRVEVSPEARRALRSAFRTLYRSGLNTSRALEALERSAETDEVRELVAFIRAAKRGVCRYARTQAFVDELAAPVEVDET